MSGPPVVQRVDEQQLYDALLAGVSQNASLLQQSAQALKSMSEEYFGTFDALQSIAAQKAAPLPVRQLALIQFKNNALGHWRSRKLLSDELRNNIKQRIFSFLDEEDDTLAATNALIVSKIARSDIAKNWHSDLASQLVSIISPALQAWVSVQNPNEKAPIALRRSLQVLHATIKELVTIKMLGGIKATGQLVVALYQTLLDYYGALSPEILSLHPDNLGTARASDNILIAHLVFKSLSQLSQWLFSQVGKKDPEFQVFSPALQSFCQGSATLTPRLVDLRSNLLGAVQLPSLPAAGVLGIVRLTTHIRTYGKLFRRMQQLDKIRFVTLPDCTPLVFFYWSKVVQSTQASSEQVQDSPTALYPVRFLVQAMVLFQNSLSVWAPVSKKGEPNAVVMPDDQVKEAVKVLVTQFIPLKMNDLQEWENNPEQWVNEEDAENDQWEYELRPCGERLLMTFANQYHQCVVPLLVETFNQLFQQPPSADLSFIQQKEALYCAIGRCAHRLKGVIDFEGWLRTALIAEARETNPIYRILKRRIAWVIGKWVSEGCASPQNTLVWEVLVYLLQETGPSTDTVVQVTAAMALCDCVDTIDFDLQVFLPYLQPSVAKLVQLAREADDIITKRRITKALNVVIERAGQHIVPLLEPIAQSIPELWSESENDWLFKASLVETTTKLVEAASSDSRLLHPIVVPLIKESLQPAAALHLDEDALNLWLSALRCSVLPLPPSPNIFELLPLAIRLLGDNLDLLGKITSIIESYYLLGADLVLQQYAVPLFEAYKNSLSKAFAANIKYLLVSLQFLVQLAPSTLWGEALHTSGLFPALFATLMDDEVDSLVLSEHVHLFARIALVDGSGFCALIQAAVVQQETQKSGNPSKADNANRPIDPWNAAWEGLMDQWWNRFDSMSEPRHRKLTAMAMANLLTSGNEVVLKRLPSEIFNLWLDVFGEVKEATNRSEDRPDSPLNRYWEQDDKPDAIFGDTEGTPEYNRRQAFWDTDPVRTTQLTTFVAARLQQAGQTAPGGPQQLHEIMLSADPTVLKQIQAELSGA